MLKSGGKKVEGLGRRDGKGIWSVFFNLSVHYNALDVYARAMNRNRKGRRIKRI
jgi:hypothetical protein